MSRLSSVISRIEKLLRLAERSTFHGESEAAQAAAQKLITEYQISEAELNDNTSSNEIGFKVVATPPPYTLDKSVLLNAIAKQNFCRVLRSDNSCYIYGTDSDIKLCLTLYNNLVVDMVNTMFVELSKAKSESSEKFSTRPWITSFFGGYCIAIAKRLKEAKDKVINDQVATQPSVSLVVRDKEHAIEVYYQQIERNKTKQRELDSDEGYNAGYMSGSNADLLQTKLNK
jgi:hypothetical protein